eukprot:Nk52_evm1s1634 gene=Nk52_evmTU1s1634
MRVQALGVVAHCMQQVGLAQAGAPVDEQRVVGLGRGLGHGRGRRLGEAVRGADDEGVEGVLAVEPGVLAEGRLVRAQRPPRGRARGGRRGTGEGGEARVGAGVVGRGALVVAAAGEPVRGRAGARGAGRGGQRQRGPTGVVVGGQHRALVPAER